MSKQRYTPVVERGYPVPEVAAPVMPAKDEKQSVELIGTESRIPRLHSRIDVWKRSAIS